MNAATVYVVDDDAAVRDSLAMLLETSGLTVETFASAEAFLAGLDAQQCACLVLDMRMPGMSGLALQAELARRDIHLPTVFLTAHGDIPTTVRAMKAGALDFLTKPVAATELLGRIEAALARARADRERELTRENARARLAVLSERERAVLALAITGCANKEIARRLGISHRTVEVHRAHILLKTGAVTFLQLAQWVSASGLLEPPSA